MMTTKKMTKKRKMMSKPSLLTGSLIFIGSQQRYGMINILHSHESKQLKGVHHFHLSILHLGTPLISSVESSPGMQKRPTYADPLVSHNPVPSTLPQHAEPRIPVQPS